MRVHSANELNHTADILRADLTGIVQSGIRVELVDLTGRRLEQAQLVASETSHMFVMRFQDAEGMDKSCYIVCDGITYIVDYFTDPRVPRHRMWLEVYCHVEGQVTVGS